MSLQLSWQGLPDFFQPIAANGYSIYYPYENAGHFLVAPVGLEIGDRPDGDGDFLLELVRGVNPKLAPYGVLDFRLQPCYELTEPLVQVRDRHPAGVVEPLLLASGWLRLQAGDQVSDIPEDLKVPIPLSWNGLGNVRLSLKLSASTATLIKGALQGEYLPLSACAEMELAGVAPRLPLQVQFNPVQLLAALGELGGSSRCVARSSIVRFFQQDLSLLPLTVTGKVPGDVPKDVPAEVQDLATFAETMADWVRVYWGTFTPSPQLNGETYLSLAATDTVGSGQMVWDLSQPLQTFRPVVLYLNPLAAVKEAIAQHGSDAFIRNTIVPSFSTGMLPVTIFANLPDYRPNVDTIGVTLKAAPYLPYRPQAAIATQEFTPPDDTAIALLRLSPTELPDYTATTYALITDSYGIRKFKSVEIPGNGNTLYLSPADFPLTFISIEAFTVLLTVCTLHGTCRWPEAGTTIEQSFELNLDHPRVALALPQGIAGATLDITARALQSDQTLRLDPLPAKSLKLGLHSFREYGPQHIQLQCQFADDSLYAIDLYAINLYAIDLLPEGRPETPDEISVVAFTPAQPHKTWTYLVRSPFQAGYRYRVHPDFDHLPSSWSPVQSPFEPLTIFPMAATSPPEA